MSTKRTLFVLPVLAAIALALGLGASANAETDTTPPTPPRMLWAFGYDLCEVNFGYGLATDDHDPMLTLDYEIYADGVLVDVWDRPRPRPPSTTTGRAAVYVPAPGDIAITLRAVDQAGNRSAASNAVIANDVFGC